MTFWLQAVALLISSVLSFAFIYYKVSITNLQQVVVGVLIILIIASDRFIIKAAKPVNFALRLFLLFLISLSLQALVLSTGGLYSPFLILFHLFAISLSFLVDVKTATAFLIFSIAVLGLATAFDQRLAAINSGDIGSIALYLLSFIVIIPLSQFVAQKYHLKDALSKILTQQLKVQKELFEGLSDIVIITDTTLKILSFNEAATRGLRLSPSELTGQFLFGILILKDTKDRVVDEKYLSIAEILQDKTTRIVKDLLMYVRNTSIPRKVNIQVRPTINLEGKIDQIALIISDVQALGKEEDSHQSLQQALLKHEAVLDELHSKLISKGMVDLASKAELFGKVENDILTAMEIQDHGLKPVIELKDAAQVIPRIISIESLFAKILGVNLQFEIDRKFTQEAVKFIPAGSKFSPSMVTSPFFTVPVDGKWFDLLMVKLLDVVILFVSSTQYPQVKVFLSYDQQFVYISIMINSATINTQDSRLFFTEYYGKWGMNSNLRLGSGLEGYMAKTVASLLGIPLDVRINRSLVTFSLQLSKKPKDLT